VRDVADVPKLRFSEFEGTWEEKRLGDAIGSIDSGWSPLCMERQATADEWGVLATTSTTWDGYSDKFNKALPTSLEPKAAMEVRAGDILVTRAGPFERVGVIAHVDATRSKLMLSDKLIRIRSRTENDSRFISKLLGRDRYQRFLAGRKSGLAEAQVNITQDILQKGPVILPTLSEQQKIADFLGAVDERIKLLQRRRDAVQRYKQGMMQRIFAQSIRFKRNDGTAFPEWEKRRLREAGKINPTSDPIPAIFQYIDLESVNSGALGRTSTIAACDAPDRAQRVVKIGDILFQTVRPYQQNNLFFTHGADFVASTGYAQIRSEENSKFLYHTVQSPAFVREVVRRCTGTSYPAINSSDLGDIRIGYPHSDEQQKIADFLSALDGKIAAVAAQVDQMQAFKKGLLQQMFV
jgi:type I restriction enzyme, S subunit